MKMKSVLLIVLIGVFGNLRAQEKVQNDSFTIKIKFSANSVVKNLQLNGEDRYIKVMKPNDKNKSFRGTVSSYGIFNLMVDYFDEQKKQIVSTNIPLFIVPGYTEITFPDNTPVIRIDGISATPRLEYALLGQDDEEYLKRIQELENKMEEIQKSGNKEQLAEIRKKISKAEEDRRENLYARYVRHNPKSAVGLYAMDMYAMMNYENPLEVEALMNNMGTEQLKTPRMIRLQKSIEKSKKVMVGVMAPEFVQKDTSGHSLALKDLQGNYVLLDFWASWCHPCREQNPSLVMLYEKFKNNGFTILSVSLDSKRENWVMAIRHDKLNWHHVSDLKLWDNEVAHLYNITSVPQNFLLDTKGKIVAKNLSEEDLETFLAEVYKNGAPKAEGTR